MKPESKQQESATREGDVTRPSHPELFGYAYAGQTPSHTSAYLWPPVERLVGEALRGRETRGRVLDLGCGNGALVARLSGRGYQVTGVEPSPTGIEAARQARPELPFVRASAYDDLSRLGAFDVVVCLEVIEHCFLPRLVARNICSLLTSGGTAIVSTPYHGYWKHLLIALLARTDAHFDPLWDYGHIKFWSPRTLGALLREAGLEAIRIHRVGRIPPFAKSMIAVARKSR